MKPLALVVENDSGTRKLLEVLVSRIGIEVDLVATASDAILLLEQIDYDLVLLELLFAGTSGMEVLAWTEANRREALDRTVVVSSAPQMHLRRVAATWPSVRIIRKPFELEEMLAVLNATAGTAARRSGDSLEEFWRRSVRAGAKAGTIVALNGTSIEPVVTFGYKPGTFEAFLPLAIDAPVPLCAAMRFGQPVWLASLLMANPDYPLLAPAWERNESRAICCVPILRGDRIIGAAGWSFREARLFNESERELFLSIGEVAQTVLRTASLNDSAVLS